MEILLHFFISEQANDFFSSQPDQHTKKVLKSRYLASPHFACQAQCAAAFTISHTRSTKITPPHRQLPCHAQCGTAFRHIKTV